MYGARLPRTKLLSPLPAASFDGLLTVDGRELPVEGWRGMIGHNWGSEHAERWIWLHGITEDGDWLDAAVGRVKLGPLTTPWIANGVLSLAGERHRLGGPGRRSRGRRGARQLRLPAHGQGAARARVGVGPARALRRLGLRRPRRRRAQHRQLLDRGHAAGGRAAGRRAPLGARPSRAAPPTSSACASATTASRSSPTRTGEGRGRDRRRQAARGGLALGGGSAQLGELAGGRARRARGGAARRGRAHIEPLRVRRQPARLRVRARAARTAAAPGRALARRPVQLRVRAPAERARARHARPPGGRGRRGRPLHRLPVRGRAPRSCAAACGGASRPSCGASRRRSSSPACADAQGPSRSLVQPPRPSGSKRKRSWRRSGRCCQNSQAAGASR